MLFLCSFPSLEGIVIIARRNISNFTTKLPQGNQTENFEVKLEVQIFDSFGDAATVELTVQVGYLHIFRVPCQYIPSLVPGSFVRT